MVLVINNASQISPPRRPLPNTTSVKNAPPDLAVGTTGAGACAKAAIGKNIIRTADSLFMVYSFLLSGNTNLNKIIILHSFHWLWGG